MSSDGPNMTALKRVAQLMQPVTLPDCVKDPNLRFCRVGWTKPQLTKELAKIEDETQAKSALERFKVPYGRGWETDTFTWDAPGLQDWVKAGGNYGIVAGSLHEVDGHQCRLIIIDVDNPQALAKSGFEDELATAIPSKQTLRVKTGREDPPGGHIYLLSDLTSSKAHIELPGYCHFKFYASQCVGPGSLHPSGRRYEVVDDSAPAFVDAEALMRAILAATRTLCPDKVGLVKKALGSSEVKVATPVRRLDKNIKRLEEIRKQSLAQKQQQEAQAEAAYNALKQRISDQDGLQAEEAPVKAKSEPLNGLILAVKQEERINPCLRRLTEALPACRRFEAAISYEGKPGEGEHNLRLAWATALVKVGYSDEQIHALAQHFDDYEPSRTQQQIESVRSYVAQGGDYHPCGTLKGYIPSGWCQECRWAPPSTGATQPMVHSTLKKDAGQDEESEVKARAEEIIRSGQFPEFWVEVFQRRHVGDQHIALGMAAASLSANILNSNGIAVLQVAGGSGDGKSHAVEATAEQMGHWCDISGLSPKALLYHAGTTVFEGMMVVLDDNRPDEAQADIIKRAQTQFKKGYQYKTIVKGQPVTKQMPPGVQLLTTQVDADAEGEVLNRTWLMEVQGSIEKDQKILQADLTRAETGEQPLADPDIKLCQAAFGMLKSQRYIVTVPEARKRIRWLERTKDRRVSLRNYNIFMDTLRAYAVMRWPQRVHHRDEDGVVHVEATRQDFMDALALYQHSHKQMQTKLTARELDLVALVKRHGGRVSREEAMRELNISKGRLTHLLNGKNGQGGLLAKYPGIYVEEMMELEEDAVTYKTRHIKKKNICLAGFDAGQVDEAVMGLAAAWVESGA